MKGYLKGMRSDRLLFERPIRIQKIIDERGGYDADCLMDLRDAVRIGHA